VYTISSLNNALIFNFSILFDGKVNLVGALHQGCQNLKFPVFYKNARKTKKKKQNRKNREFLR